MNDDRGIIVEEIRSLRDLTFQLCRWGVTLLLSLQVVIFFVRKSIIANLIEVGKLEINQQLPLSRFLIGTSYMFFVATIFTFLTYMCMKRISHYKKNLIEIDTSSSIKWRDVPKYGGLLIVILYFSFPLVDILIRTYITIKFSISIQ